jgi:hypothetical protein
MSNKILIAVAAAILLASTGLASGKTQTHWRAPCAYDYYVPCATIDSVTGTCRISLMTLTIVLPMKGSGRTTVLSTTAQDSPTSVSRPYYAAPRRDAEAGWGFSLQ